MPWPVYDGSTTFPTGANNPTGANTGLYTYGAQSDSFGTRLWVFGPSLTPPTNAAAFTLVGNLRKADLTPVEFEKREVSHLLSPYQIREHSSSWGQPSSYEFEFNFTTALYNALCLLTPGPEFVDRGHRYIIVEDPDHSCHQLYGFFQAPKKTHTIESGDNVITVRFESLSVDYYVKSVP
jgi:hypothetical protein